MIRLTVALCIDSIVRTGTNEIVPRQALAQLGEAVEALAPARRPALLEHDDQRGADARRAPGSARRAARGSPGGSRRERSGSRTESAWAREPRGAAAHGCRRRSCPAPARCRRAEAAAPARRPGAAALVGLGALPPGRAHRQRLAREQPERERDAQQQRHRHRAAEPGQRRPDLGGRQQRGRRPPADTGGTPSPCPAPRSARGRRERQRRPRRDARESARRPARWPATARHRSRSESTLQAR